MSEVEQSVEIAKRKRSALDFFLERLLRSKVGNLVARVPFLAA